MSVRKSCNGKRYVDCPISASKGRLWKGDLFDVINPKPYLAVNGSNVRIAKDPDTKSAGPVADQKRPRPEPPSVVLASASLEKTLKTYT